MRHRLVPSHKIEKACSDKILFIIAREERSGRDDWIRTSDLTHPKRARYQAALRPDRGGSHRAELEASPTRAAFDINERITGVREASRKRAACRANRAGFCGSKVRECSRCAAPRPSPRGHQHRSRED